MLLTFLSKTINKCGFPDEAKRFSSIIRNQVRYENLIGRFFCIEFILFQKMLVLLIPERVILTDAPDSILPSIEQLQFLALTDIDDKEIARQLCLIDQKLFQAIKPSEFQNL